MIAFGRANDDLQFFANNQGDGPGRYVRSITDPSGGNQMQICQCLSQCRNSRCGTVGGCFVWVDQQDNFLRVLRVNRLIDASAAAVIPISGADDRDKILGKLFAINVPIMHVMDIF